MMALVTRAPSSSIRPKGSAARNTSSASPSIVPNRLALSTSSPAIVSTPASVARRPGRSTAATDSTTSPSTRSHCTADSEAEQRFVHLHLVRREGEHVVVGQPREERRRSFFAESFGESLAAVGGEHARFAPLDRGRGLHEEVTYQARLRRAPRRGSGRTRVADREQVEQTEPFGVGRARGRHVVGHRRVGEVAARRDFGHQQVIAHEPHHDLAALAVEPDAARHRGCGRRADLRVIAGPALGDVVQQRAEEQQFRPAQARGDDGLHLVVRDAAAIARVEESRALGDGFEQVPVDGEAVVRVALRQRPHVLPFREQAARAHLRDRAPRTRAPRSRPRAGGG